MKNILSSLFLSLGFIFILSTNAFTQQLTKQQKNGKYGVVNSSGETVVPFEFQRIKIYDFCIIAIDGKEYKTFKTTGKVYLEGVFQKVEVYPVQGYVVVKENRKYSIYTKDKKRLSSGLEGVDKIEEHRTAVKYLGKWFHWEKGEILKDQ